MIKNKGRKEIGLPFDVLNHIRQSKINLSVAVEEWYRQTYMKNNPDIIKKKIEEIKEEYENKIKKCEDLIETQHFEVIELFNKLTDDEKEELSFIKYLLNEKKHLNPHLTEIRMELFNKKFNRNLILFQFNKILEKIELITKSKFDKLNKKQPDGTRTL